MTECAVQSRKQRWLEFFDLASPRRVAYLIRYAPDLPFRPLPNPECRQERIEWIWQNYEYHLKRVEWLDDDTVPPEPLTPAEWLSIVPADSHIVLDIPAASREEALQLCDMLKRSNPRGFYE